MENKVTTKKILTFEADVECPDCKGTGLYVGMAERDGAAVICFICDGTGKKHIKHEYTEFTERQVRPGVERVFETAGGYCISSHDVNTDSGLFPFTKAGCSYKEWLQGKIPEPIRFLHCPLEHFSQGTVKGEFLKTCHCEPYLELRISVCSKQRRATCWETWDKEFSKLSDTKLAKMDKDKQTENWAKHCEKYGCK